MAENYVKCRCQHCDGGIEFDANQLENGTPRIMDCPHCGLETILYIPAQKSSPLKTEILPSVPAERDIAAELRPIMRRQFEDPRPRKGDIICLNPNCRYVGPGKSEGHGAVGLALGALFLPAGIAYLGVMGSKCICPKCGTRTNKIP